MSFSGKKDEREKEQKKKKRVPIRQLQRRDPLPPSQTTSDSVNQPLSLPSSISWFILESGDGGSVSLSPSLSITDGTPSPPYIWSLLDSTSQAKLERDFLIRTNPSLSLSLTRDNVGTTPLPPSLSSSLSSPLSFSWRGSSWNVNVSQLTAPSRQNMYLHPASQLLFHIEQQGNKSNSTFILRSPSIDINPSSFPSPLFPSQLPTSSSLSPSPSLSPHQSTSSRRLSSSVSKLGKQTVWSIKREREREWTKLTAKDNAKLWKYYRWVSGKSQFLDSEYAEVSLSLSLSLSLSPSPSSSLSSSSLSSLPASTSLSLQRTYLSLIVVDGVPMSVSITTHPPAFEEDTRTPLSPSLSPSLSPTLSPIVYCTCLLTGENIRLSSVSNQELSTPPSLSSSSPSSSLSHLDTTTSSTSSPSLSLRTSVSTSSPSLSLRTSVSSLCSSPSSPSPSSSLSSTTVFIHRDNKRGKGHPDIRSLYRYTSFSLSPSFKLCFLPCRHTPQTRKKEWKPLFTTPVRLGLELKRHVRPVWSLIDSTDPPPNPSLSSADSSSSSPSIPSSSPSSSSRTVSSSRFSGRSSTSSRSSISSLSPALSPPFSLRPLHPPTISPSSTASLPTSASNSTPSPSPSPYPYPFPPPPSSSSSSSSSSLLSSSSSSSSRHSLSERKIRNGQPLDPREVFSLLQQSINNQSQPAHVSVKFGFVAVRRQSFKSINTISSLSSLSLDQAKLLSWIPHTIPPSEINHSTLVSRLHHLLSTEFKDCEILPGSRRNLSVHKWGSHSHRVVKELYVDEERERMKYETSHSFHEVANTTDIMVLDSGVDMRLKISKRRDVERERWKGEDEKMRENKKERDIQKNNARNKHQNPSHSPPLPLPLSGNIVLKREGERYSVWSPSWEGKRLKYLRLIDETVIQLGSTVSVSLTTQYEAEPQSSPSLSLTSPVSSSSSSPHSRSNSSGNRISRRSLPPPSPSLSSSSSSSPSLLRSSLSSPLSSTSPILLSLPEIHVRVDCQISDPSDEEATLKILTDMCVATSLLVDVLP